jgi:hypothetical protein
MPARVRGSAICRHSLVVDENNILYVADCENGRIEKFDLDGKFLSEMPNLGEDVFAKTGSTWDTMGGGAAAKRAARLSWLGTQAGSQDRRDPVTEPAGLHFVEDAGEGQPMTDVGLRVVWFKSH